jgi:hypothetical protein
MNKGLFRILVFYNPIWRDSKEYVEEHDIASNKSDLGQNEKWLKSLIRYF